jgi:hypothetical protein
MGGWGGPKPVRRSGISGRFSRPARDDERMKGDFSGGQRSWVESLCRLPLDFKQGNSSIRQLSELAAPDLNDKAGFLEAVAAVLRNDPDLADAWQTYSYDKRTDEGPYMEGTEVGFYSAGRRDVHHHDDPAAAGADFIFREMQWVLHRRRTE